MWFRNLRLYRFSKDFTLAPEQIDQALQEKSFTPCLSQQPSSQGWTAPLGKDGQSLVHVTDGNIMICAKREERIMPAAAVKELLNARIEQIEEREGRRIQGKEKTSLKDEVILDMLPRAFTRSSLTYAYLSAEKDWLIIDSGSPNKADEFNSLLRESLGSLPIHPLSVANSPTSLFTQWVKQGHAEQGFGLEDECDLRDARGDGGIVRVKKQDLGSDEIQSHIEAGKIVTKLALTFDDRISFTLDETLAIKRLKFLDLVYEQLDDVNAETAAEQFDADFAIMALELARFLPQLIIALGGESKG